MAFHSYQSFDDVSQGSEGQTRLNALRDHLAKAGLDGFIIPRADEHQNEYLPASEERLAWLTGFTGSYGSAVILTQRAAVFSDGRYTEQLNAQVDRTAYEPLTVTDHHPWDWLAEHAAPKTRIGYDPRRITTAALKRYADAAERKGVALVPVDSNPVDSLWTNRPSAPATAIVLHPLRYAGLSASEKILSLQQSLRDEGLGGLMLTDPTSLAWLFNIRASDVPHKPIPLGYAIVPSDSTPLLFVDAARMTNATARALGKVCKINPPDGMLQALTQLAKGGARLRFDSDSASVWLCDHFRTAGGTPDIGTDPIALRRAVKNSAEIEGARQAQMRDGVAMVSFLHWLDTTLPGARLTEIDAALKLEQFRRATGHLKDISFGSISAAGPNAALPHYRVTTASNRALTKGFYLIDSGGQYLDGTTDITRVVVVGSATTTMRDRFTRVLKGMIAISRIVFPIGTSGAQIDSFARHSLWSAGLDFDHGTGHGVGSYLGVHEGPQRISKLGHTPLKSGMILSNEPGYYKPGAYGIRIENLVLVEPRSIKGAERSMLGFETLTLCPIDRRAIDIKLLTEDERLWLNAYHARVEKTLAPHLEPPARRWLKAACKPL